MKKFTFLMLFFVSAAVMFAQTRSGQNSNITPKNNEFNISVSTDKAIGDTMFYFDGTGFFVNTADQPAFNFVNEDIDGLTPYNAGSGWTSDWMGFYSEDAADLQPMDVDTAFFLGATSWFNPAGQADNWFAFGPITVPAATGLKLKWNVKCNAGYRDGYKVHASSTGMSNYTDFTETPLFVRADQYPSTTEGTDTVWTSYEVNIPSAYNGGPVYVAFQHDANDMDVLFLDEMFLIEAQVLSVNENSLTVSQNFPNPVKTTSLFSYQLTEGTNVTVEIFDIAGKLIKSMEQGYKAAGTHQITINAQDMANGTYFYTLTAGNFQSTKKMVVLK